MCDTNRDYAAYDKQNAQQGLPIVLNQKNSHQPRDDKHDHKNNTVTNLNSEKRQKMTTFIYSENDELRFGWNSVHCLIQSPIFLLFGRRSLLLFKTCRF